MLNQTKNNFNLTVDNLSFRYHQNDYLFKQVNLEISSKEKIMLYGKSGSGKTTFFKLLNYLLPYQEGSILYDTVPIKDLVSTTYRSKVLYLSSNPFLFPTTVEDNLKFPFTLNEYKKQNLTYNSDITKKYLYYINLDESFLKTSISSLSSGERQILSFLRTIQLNPSIYLLDEPLSSVDQDTKIKLENILIDKIEETTSSFIMISHEKEQALRLKTKNFILSNLTLIDYIL